MITSDQELLETVAVAGECLQDIQDCLGLGFKDMGRVRFPRGFIRKADHFRRQLSFIADQQVRDNVAYALIQSDVYLWLINRTDLFGIAREMTIKSAIALMGSINETLAITGTKGTVGRRHSFCERCNRMVDKGIIEDPLRQDLHWLWEIRSAIHIYNLDHRELEKYTMNDFNRAVSASRNLRQAISNFHNEKEK